MRKLGGPPGVSKNTEVTTLYYKKKYIILNNIFFVPLGSGGGCGRKGAQQRKIFWVCQVVKNLYLLKYRQGHCGIT
jgi:hypothetical protein